MRCWGEGGGLATLGVDSGQWTLVSAHAWKTSATIWRVLLLVLLPRNALCDSVVPILLLKTRLIVLS